MLNSEMIPMGTFLNFLITFPSDLIIVKSFNLLIALTQKTQLEGAP